MQPPAYQEPTYEIPFKIINGVEVPTHNKDLQDYYDEVCYMNVYFNLF